MLVRERERERENAVFAGRDPGRNGGAGLVKRGVGGCWACQSGRAGQARPCWLLYGCCVLSNLARRRRSRKTGKKEIPDLHVHVHMHVHVHVQPSHLAVSQEGSGVHFAFSLFFPLTRSFPIASTISATAPHQACWELDLFESVKVTFPRPGHAGHSNPAMSWFVRFRCWSRMGLVHGLWDHLTVP